MNGGRCGCATPGSEDPRVERCAPPGDPRVVRSGASSDPRIERLAARPDSRIELAGAAGPAFRLPRAEPGSSYRATRLKSPGPAGAGGGVGAGVGVLEAPEFVTSEPAGTGPLFQEDLPTDDIPFPSESWSSGWHTVDHSIFYVCGSDLGRWGKVDQEIAEYMQRPEIPGGSVAVINRTGELVYARGFMNVSAYEAARELPQRIVCPTSRFRIASISKVLTAVGVMKCEELGLLPNGLDTTLKDLGLDEYYDSTLAGAIHDEAWYKEDEWVAELTGVGFPVSRANVLSCVASTSITTPPGSWWNYATDGFILLARVIETVTGRDYEPWMVEKVLAPCGAVDTVIGEADRFPDNEVAYYGACWPWELEEDGSVAADHVTDKEVIRADGFGATVMDSSGRTVYVPRGTRNFCASDGGSGWVSTGLDLCRLMRALLCFPDGAAERTVLTAANVSKMVEKYATIWTDVTREEVEYKQGLGFKVELYRGENYDDCGHTGHLEGTQARLHARATLADTGGINTLSGYVMVALFNRHAAAWDDTDDEGNFHVAMREHVKAAVLATGAGDLWDEF